MCISFNTFALIQLLYVVTFYDFIFTLVGLGGYRCEGAREVLQIIGYPAFLVERDFYSYKTISPQSLYLKYIMKFLKKKRKRTEIVIENIL